MTRHVISTPANPASSITGHSPWVIPRHRRGFALLITVTLLAFLVLLLVSLASLTRVETQVASNNQSLAQARQNALMALNIALGQLQKYTGPDQRVTARADIILPASVTITPPTFNFDNFDTNPNGGKFTAPGSTGKDVLDALGTYWGTSGSIRNRNWTGAWRNTNTSTFDKNNPAAFNAAPGRFINDDPAQPGSTPVWLVSGSESATAFSPTSPVTGLSLSSNALDDTLQDGSIPGLRHRLLVGRASTGATSNADLVRYVTAPQMPVRGTVPGLANEQDIGHYAWWIGDEGVKARAGILDPFGPAAGAVPSSPEAPRNIKRRQSAQRPVLEAMTTNGADGLAPFFDDLASDARLRKLVTASQLSLLENTSAFRVQLDERLHDLTVYSRGVLADTKHGGLKRDLTYILGQPDLAGFRTALNSGGYNVAPSNTYNIALTSAATPYATIPDNEPAGAAYDAAFGIFAGSTTWEQLWAFYNMRENTPLGVFNGGVAASRPSSGTQHPLYPLLVQAKLFYSMEVTGGAVTLRITPVAVVANPYNVPLSGDFILSFNNPAPVVVSGTLSTPPPAPENLIYTGTGPTDAVNKFKRIGGRALANGGLEKISLIIKATAIPAGTAQIFTVAPSANLTIANQNDTRDVPMRNTYDPSVYLTYPTGLSIDTASGHTHAALYATGMNAQLHMGTKDTVNRVAYVGTKSPSTSTGAPVESGFVVYPLAGGYHRGGGVFFALQDGKNAHQQSLFYQLNFRSLIVDTIGSTSYGDHPLQWGTAYGVIGQEGDTDTSPHPLLSANILAPLNETIPATTRWGLVASGEYPSLNTVPPEITDSQTSLVNLLYDIPRPEASVTSLGQLQHLNLTGQLSNPGASLTSNAFLVNYPIGNSYPGPRVRRHRVFYSSAPFGRHFDASYIWNDLLWDRFTFSSFPQTDPFEFGDDADGHLVNSRYRPFRPAGEIAPGDETQFRGVHKPARNLLVEGAFNINSTSVEAWKALFSSLKAVPIGTGAAPSAPFSRTLSPGGGSANARNGISANAWNGFNDLTQTEINELAEEMVLQIRLRGPFLSLADFVNRKLVTGPATRTNGSDHPDPYRLGLSGALQAAIDRTINRKAAVPQPYAFTPRRNETVGTRDGTGDFRGLYLADLEYRMHTRIAGYPGYLLQGDVLSAVAPNLAARSDTFTIRTYGDVQNPATGEVTGRAWCEAVVQRTPDYIVPKTAGGNDPEEIPAAGSANEKFGRRYQVVSFRWLNSNDI